MQRGLPFTALVLVLAASVGWLAWASLHAICYRDPPAALSAAQRPVSAPSRQPKNRPERVIVVVLDGLRFDTSRSMPYVMRLGSSGVDAMAHAPSPSLSRPSYATMATGADPVRSGVRNNSFRDEVALDTMFDRVKAAGGSTAGAANLSWWHENFARGFDHWFPMGPDPDQAIRLALGANAALVVIHLVDLDRIAHHDGARNAYQARALELDRTLERVLGSVDSTRSTLIVTSDHGHRDRGGHGGPEPEVVRVPFVLSGFGIRRGAVLGDVGGVGTLGPTVATLLGTELPRDATAEPLLAALDADVFGADYIDARLSDARTLKREYDARLRARDGTAEQKSLAGLSAWRNGSGELCGSPLGRIAASLVILGGLALLARARRRGRSLLPIAVLPLLGAGPVIALRVADLPWSLSAIVQVRLLVEVLAVGVAGGFIAYLLALRWVLRTTPDDVVFHLRFAALVMLALAPLTWLWTGYRHPLSLPAPPLLFAPLALAFIGGGSALLLALAALLWMRTQNSRAEFCVHSEHT